MKTSSAKWAATAASLAVLAGLALFLRAAEPGTAAHRVLPRCGLHQFTGLHCSGCGITRASRALLHGDLAGAFRQNALFVSALPLLAFAAWRTWWFWLHPERRRPLLPFLWRYGYSMALLGLVLLFGVLRNIPAEPFARLAPEPVSGTRDVADRAAPPPDTPPSPRQ